MWYYSWDFKTHYGTGMGHEVCESHMQRARCTLEDWTFKIYSWGTFQPREVCHSSDAEDTPNTSLEPKQNLQPQIVDTFSYTSQVWSKLEPCTSSFNFVNKLHKANHTYYLHSKVKVKK